MTKLILIATGGAIGASLRWAVSLLYLRLSSSLFPWPTFTANCVGCLLIGFVLGIHFQRPLGAWLFFIVVGILGGFTTFSSFAFETFSLIQRKQFSIAGLYLVLSNVLGVGFAVLGFKLAK